MASDPTGGPQPHQPHPHHPSYPNDVHHAPRAGDRRGGDRRALERRAPPPLWRRPWALVSFGVLGALVVVGVLRALGGGDDSAEMTGTLTPAPAPEVATAPAPQPPPAAALDSAFGAQGMERLVIEGDEAHGKRVLTELFCEAPSPVALTPPPSGQVEAPVAALADAARRVPAADCKWGARDDQRREDFVLLVPTEMAEPFAAARVINDDFVQRRRLVAEVEWIGRSPSLALRTVGILRGVRPSS